MKGPRTLFLLALGVVLLVTTPTIFVIYSALTLEVDVWIKLYKTRMGFLLLNTLKLIFAVGLLVLVLGTMSAWFVTRYDFWGRRFWQVVLLLPFAIPGYVMAYAYTSMNSPNSPLGKIFYSLGDFISMPSLSPFWAVVLVFSLINYPYVYLLTRASFLVQNETYEELAKISGVRGWKKFWKINLSFAYPGMMAGLALALMEVLSDFGTVSLLRYPTFTEAIYRQMTGRFDPYGASAFSFVLLTLTILILNLERYYRTNFVTVSGRFRPIIPRKLGLWGCLGVNIALLILTMVSFFLPMGVLFYWAVKSLWEGFFDTRLIKFTLNTLTVSGLGAILASILAFPIAYSYVRLQGILPKLIYNLGTIGYGLPGPVIAVALLLFFENFLPMLIGSFLVLPYAYLVRFLPIAVQSQKASLSSLSRNVEEVGATLGASFLRISRKIIIPLTAPGFFTGLLVVFVDSMKELPATLMLRPLAFDTLAVRVYTEAVESLWEPAALPAILIVGAGFLPVYFLLRMSSNWFSSEKKERF